MSMKPWILFGTIILCSCARPPEKINGISFVASREKVEQRHIDPLLGVHANYASIMPLGFMAAPDSPRLVFDTDRQWYGETRQGAEQYIRMLHESGVKVMLKPQIWISKGAFTGNMAMDSEEDWEQLEDSYARFILLYASLAGETQVELFCIGTELARFVEHRPAFWQELIKKVRALYPGKLTYAANWDEYAKTPFWEELDYIGVNAYFPLSEDRHPSPESLALGWQKWKPKLMELSRDRDRPIVFTEFGYRSMDHTGHRPWLVDRQGQQVNLQGQADAMQAIFDAFWGEDWFAGGFVWKWFIHHERAGGAEDNRFTPQRKPAQSVIREQFAKFARP